ncbi:MAG: restriction endonuclease [Cytophagales bacterium]|nr:restriction endonuclease [Cytophagales bacterium]
MKLNNEFNHFTKLRNAVLPPAFRSIQELKRRIKPFESPVSRSAALFDQYQSIAIFQDLKTGIPEKFLQHEFFHGETEDYAGLEYGFEDQMAELDEKQVIEVIDGTKLIISDIYKDNNLLDIIEPRQFEEVVAELLQSEGYDVELTKRTRDGGYDIIALKMASGGLPLKFLVECKRHKSKIGIDIIRSFCDVIREENANKGIIFTTSYFSTESIKRQQKMGTILDFQNRKDVIDWVIKYEESRN